LQSVAIQDGRLFKRSNMGWWDKESHDGETKEQTINNPNSKYMLTVFTALIKSVRQSASS